jgi:hypothetical protein
MLTQENCSNALQPGLASVQPQTVEKLRVGYGVYTVREG